MYDPNKFAAIVMALNTALLATTAHAQVERSGGGGGEAARIMQQYQQVAAEKTALQSQLAQAKKDLEASQSELAAAKKERDALKGRAGAAATATAEAARLTTTQATTEKNLEQYKQRLMEVVAKFRELAANLKEVETDRNTLRADLGKRDAAYQSCAADNAQLYDLATQVLDRYEHVGLFTKVSAEEPFTRITRTRLDNVADEYREQAKQLRLKQNPQKSAQ
jgi:chromosome segregation ATPase